MKDLTLRLGMALVMAATLAGCSNDPTGTAHTQSVRDLVIDPLVPRSGTAAPETSQLTRAAIAKVDFPLMLVSIPDSGATSTVTVTAIKGETVTWVSVDRVSLTMDGPVLFGTRGIGPDLLTAETSTLAAMLKEGRVGSLTRSYRHLNGLDQIEVLNFQCQLTDEGAETIEVLELTHQTRKMQETCTAQNGVQIENIYWIGSDATLWKSQQWISRETGYLVTERLVK